MGRGGVRVGVGSSPKLVFRRMWKTVQQTPIEFFVDHLKEVHEEFQQKLFLLGTSSQSDRYVSDRELVITTVCMVVLFVPSKSKQAWSWGVESLNDHFLESFDLTKYFLCRNILSL